MSQSLEDATAWIPQVESFGDRLALLRHPLGLSRKAAAEKCGLDDASWAMWERKGVSPRNLDDVVRSISDELHVHRDWLMWGDDAVLDPDVRRLLLNSGWVEDRRLPIPA